MIQACEQLVTYCVNKLGPAEQTKLTHLSFVSDTLRGSVGSLLLPLFSGLWSLKLDLKHACSLLPALYRLLAAVDDMAGRMPEVIAKEKSWVTGKLFLLVVCCMFGFSSCLTTHQHTNRRKSARVDFAHCYGRVLAPVQGHLHQENALHPGSACRVRCVLTLVCAQA